MSKVYIFILGFSFCFFYSKAQQATFIKEFHNYKIDTTLQVVVPYKGELYCLKSNSQIFRINPKNAVVGLLYADNSAELNLLDLYIRNDTLIGLSKTKTYFFDGQNRWRFLKERRYIPTQLYNDDNYIITSTCSGEWGGSLYFKDKRTQKQYECECTCAVNIVKSYKGYNVTASLSHMSGFVNIFEIADPRNLKLYNRDYLKRKKIIYVGDNESKSELGKTKLIDSIGVTVTASFNYNSQIYYITEKYKKVSIDIIANKKLVPIDDLSRLNIWTDYSQNRKNDNQQAFTFSNDQNTGFVLIENNKLAFYSFDRKHK